MKVDVKVNNGNTLITFAPVDETDKEAIKKLTSVIGNGTKYISCQGVRYLEETVSFSVWTPSSRD